MFPIPWNKAYRKKDGSIVNMEDAMSGGGGGGGGGSIYNHNVLVTNGNNNKVAFNLVKDNEIPYTLDELWEISYNGGEPFQLYGSIAYGVNSVNQMYYSIEAELNGETRRLRFYNIGGSSSTALSTCTIEDHII